MSENLSELYSTSIDKFESIDSSLFKLANAPESIGLRLKDLLKGVNSLLITVSSEPEKITELLECDDTDSKDRIFIEIAASIRLLQKMNEDVALMDQEKLFESWEESSINLLLELQNALGYKNKTFLIVVWFVAKIFCDNGGERSKEIGKDLYESVEKILPEIIVKE